MAKFDETFRQASPGDPRLYEALMVDYYNFIYSLSSAILGDACEGEDAAQETFIKAVAHLNDYQVDTHIKSWLAKIAINICRDKLRRIKALRNLKNVWTVITWQNHQGAPTPEETVIHDERKKIIQSEIERLDEKHRLPVLLRYGQGMSIAEIAEILDINEGTVHSRLHYAHLKLRDRLNGVNQEPDGLPKEDFE